MSRRPLPAGVLALALLLPGAAPLRAAPDLERFTGVYVGRAEENVAGGKAEQRDIDLVIKAEDKGAVTISWTNVTLVDGRRDLPGVRRRTDEVHLAPAPDRDFFLASAAYDPFSERQAANPIAGDPLRWAVLDGDKLRTYSLVIQEDGRYELQVYARSLTKEGIALDWQRFVEGELLRHMVGHTVRAQ